MRDDRLPVLLRCAGVSCSQLAVVPSLATMADASALRRMLAKVDSDLGGWALHAFSLASPVAVTEHRAIAPLCPACQARLGAGVMRPIRSPLVLD